MSWIAYTFIHVCVYTGHTVEMQDTCAIFNWNDKKNGVKGEIITKKDTKWFYWFLWGCKYCMCCSFRICPDIIE